jgi:subtilase family serine protease
MHRRTIAILAAVGLTTTGLVSGGSPAVASDRSSLADSHPAWATPQNKVANADPAGKLTFRVYLNLRGQAAAEAAAQAISTPGTSSYRQYLSTSAVRRQYAPSASSVSAVRSWLGSAGFSLGDVPDNNLFVEATGTVDQAQKAFSVSLGRYKVSGMTLRAAAQDLSVPAALGSTVAGVIGVDQSLALLRPQHIGAGDETAASTTASAAKTNAAKTSATPSVVPPPDGFRNGRPCSTYWAQQKDTTDPAFGGGFPNPLPYAPCGYKPGQIRDAYGLSPVTAKGLDGRGTTVAIVDAFASPTLYQDAAEYARRNDPAHPLKPSQFSQIVFPTNPVLEPPDQCDAAGWYGEQTLDVEAVHATAPGAHILYVGGSDCLDISLDKALNLIVSRNLAQIVSNSYGDAGEDIPASEVKLFQSIALQAVLQGIGLYFSSGDSGDEAANLGTPSADFSASSPWVTAVGGTSLGISASGRRVVDTGWETGKSVLTSGAWAPAAPGAYLYGSGGGTSRLFREPFYQRGVVPDALAKQNQTGNQRGRVVPDISMLGDPSTGFLVGQTQTFPDGVAYGEFRIGGTSLSSPLFAGLMAVADQAVGVRHGFINPTLYLVTSRTGAIKDIKHENNAVVRVDYANGLDAADGIIRSVRSLDFTGLTIHTTPGYDNVTGLGEPAGALFLLAI